MNKLTFTEKINCQVVQIQFKENYYFLNPFHTFKRLRRLHFTACFPTITWFLNT